MKCQVYNLNTLKNENLLEKVCLLDSTPKSSVKLSKSKLINGINDFIHVYMKYSLDCKKKQILFNFKFINMASFLVEEISVYLESNLSMYAMPYPDTSNSLYIKSLGSRGILEWNCVFVLNSYAETSRCRLRI